MFSFLGTATILWWAGLLCVWGIMSFQVLKSGFDAGNCINDFALTMGIIKLN